MLSGFKAFKFLAILGLLESLYQDILPPYEVNPDHPESFLFVLKLNVP